MVHSTDLPLDDTPQKRSSKLGRGDSAQLRQWRPKVRRQASRGWPVHPILVKWRCCFQRFQKPMEGHFWIFLLSLFSNCKGYAPCRRPQRGGEGSWFHVIWKWRK